ncbi:MAG: hypothetical protein ACPGOY_11740 [Rhodospirillaceae bacterium]
MLRYFLVAKALGLVSCPENTGHWYEYNQKEQSAFDRALKAQPRLLVAG